MRRIFVDRTPSGLSWLWLSGLVLVLDQLSKLAVLRGLAAYHEVVPVTGFFNLVHVHNTGAAFSLFADQSGWQRVLFVGLALVASVVILALLRGARGQSRYCAALALILGGAVGNLVDRVMYGHVIDFLDFHLGAWHWPAFNVADAAISVGAALLIWDSLRKGGRR
ncbi:MAG TPA: signal peptidase II [Thiobacillaceae bacterium]|nr:signal peptidase II [Thiobacillaceae bacterium]HNU64468.1 signal peptidase II [Thiobacillaceae bacterium]